MTNASAASDASATVPSERTAIDAISYYATRSRTNFAGSLGCVLAAMVLAAGLGTRLRPLTDVCAKPLVPVGDRPALAHLLERLRAAGAPRVVVNAHHRARDIDAFARKWGPEVAVSEEKELLGTAGGIARAGSLLGAGDVVVWNGDVLAGVDLAALVSFHGGGDADATLIVQPAAAGQGPVGVDARGRIVRLRTERFGLEFHGGEFLGISVIGAVLRERLPERGCLVSDLWLPALRGGATVRAFCHPGQWHDIGTLQGYLAANLAWLDARGLTHWVGERARTESTVFLERTVLGDGALARGSGTLARCIVWSGARAIAPLADAIVTPDRVVPVGG